MIPNPSLLWLSPSLFPWFELSHSIFCHTALCPSLYLFSKNNGFTFHYIALLWTIFFSFINWYFSHSPVLRVQWGDKHKMLNGGWVCCFLLGSTVSLSSYSSLVLFSCLSCQWHWFWYLSSQPSVCKVTGPLYRD